MSGDRARPPPQLREVASKALLWYAAHSVNDLVVRLGIVEL